MRIGLVDVDGHHWPNLCLMKIAAFYKGQGHFVDWANSLERYDKVFMAKVFSFSNDDIQAYQTDELYQGGTGYSLGYKLAEEIEKITPDYTLYGISNTAYGYLTRGCPRACPFCIVAEKEGKKSAKVANLKQFWNNQKYIKLLDPNILAAAEWEDLLGQLADSKAIVDFTQGLDIRLVNEEKIQAINCVRYQKLQFAWDNAADKLTPEILKEYSKAWKVRNDRLNVFVLTNYNSTLEEDLYRVYRLREIGYDPYIMIFDKPNAPQKIRHLQRWVNNKRIFRTTKTFEEYDCHRG